MAATLEINDPIKSIGVTSDPGLLADNKVIHELIKLLDAWFLAVQLSSFKFEPDGGIYAYEFAAADGRTWKQKIDIPENTHSSPTMTFTVMGFWSKEEFEPHRAVRDLCIGLVRNQHVSKIEVTWA